MKDVYKAIIVEDNNELRSLYATIVNGHSLIYLCGSFLSCEDALEEIHSIKPNLILMDIDLPGINGIEGTKQFRKLFPEIKILVITVLENSKTVFDALCAGASGYLSKNSSPEKIISALDEMISGGAPMSTHIAKMVVASFHKNPNSPLSQRETAVLELLASNKSYADISEELNLSKDTIKYHIRNIYQKLEVNNRADAVETATREKLI